MEETEKQHKKQYDWLKGYQFVKGQSGNPAGRPKGKSLKTFAREFIESLPDDEKVEYLRGLDPELVWKMAEGNPKQDTETELKGSLIFQVVKYGDNTNTSQVQSETIPDTSTQSTG